MAKLRLLMIAFSAIIYSLLLGSCLILMWFKFEFYQIVILLVVGTLTNMFIVTTLNNIIKDVENINNNTNTNVEKRNL